MPSQSQNVVPFGSVVFDGMLVPTEETEEQKACQCNCTVDSERDAEALPVSSHLALIVLSEATAQHP